MWDFGRIPNNPPLEQRITEASGEQCLTREFDFYLGQLHFTVLGSGHIHEVSRAHRLSNRAHPQITSSSNLGLQPSFGILRIHQPWLTSRHGSDINCCTIDTTYLHIGMILFTLSLNPHRFAMEFYPKRSHTNGDISPSLYTHDPSHF